jgi:transitional endoplasmic reticulum ATPase
VYCPRADELADAVTFARQYQSPACVLFCEDIDRVTDGERDAEVDDILNIIDGIDSKSSHLIIVLTTNKLGSIEPAMLRPGRLDAVINVTPPDDHAVERLLRVYGGDAIRPDTDLAMASRALQGRIPAVIAEVINRAKLAQLRRQERGTKVSELSEDAIIEAANTMRAQLDLLDAQSSKGKPQVPTLDQALRSLVNEAFAAREGSMT